jgi:hypothetical protein
MVFGYPAEQVKKALAALVVLGVAAAAYVIVVPVDAGQVITAFGTAVVGFLAVLGMPNASVDDWTKAIMAVVTGGAGAFALFAQTPDLTPLFDALAAALPLVLGFIVHQTTNTGLPPGGSVPSVQVVHYQSGGQVKAPPR